MRKRKVILIFIIFALLLIALGIIFMVVNNDESHIKETTPNNNNKETTENEEDNYLNYYANVSYIVSMADNFMIDYYSISDFQNLEEEKKTELILRILSTDKENKLTKENLEEEKVKYFDKNATLTYKTFETDNFQFKYDEEKEEYEIIAKEPNNYYAISKTINEYFDDNNNWIVERAIYFKEMTDISSIYPAKIYGSIEDAKNKTNEIYTINNQEEELTIDNNFNKILNQIPKYRYTLKKQNNNYQIISIERIES